MSMSQMFVLFTPGNQRSSLKPKAITGFRCGCHGLHADTGRFGRGAQQLDRGDRLCSKGGEIMPSVSGQN